MESQEEVSALIEYFESKLGRRLKENELDLIRNMIIWQQISSS
ncbi:hypothetical protein RYX56_18810 [Alkalihalophilus lindianensis]|uniref:Uncharacterized protein n=1 Tax=Alkalihalophilus lindianensis TaxID=1630542 RepID=A0ABU3XEW7_9BACI|nr:hypothetical protein [Alkalihalophilus lindianensis]MDV2686424.1 hypothetical protein [Alkalihalophilus lindianensis]